MKKKNRQKNAPEALGNSAGVLKKKTRVHSTEAALISIGIHLLLILLAGSWVAVRYVQKQKAELTVYQAPPKMERRQMALPVTRERIRQSSQRPKIVSSRVASSAAEFSVPSVAAVAKVSTQKFSSPFARPGMDFSVLTKGVTFRVPGFKFLGVRAQGEKLIFVVDASPAMLSDRTGGEAACAQIKQELNSVLSELPSSVLFNVILYDGETVEAFEPQMTPVTEENLLALRTWIAPVLSHQAPEGLVPEQNNYEPELAYDTAVGKEARGWVRAMQDALEQYPDTVFLVSRDWGQHTLSPEKGQRLMDFSLWQVLGGSGKSSVAGTKILIEDREMRNEYVLSAVSAVEQEEKALRAASYPVPFLHNLADFMQYSPLQIRAHVKEVCRSNYRSVKQAPPEIHCIRLGTREEAGGYDWSTKNLNDLVDDFDGQFKFMDGEKFREKSRDDDADAVAQAAGAKEAVESEFKFFGTNVKGSRIAFVLDVSEQMFQESTGGEAAFAAVKMQLAQQVHALNPGTRFNLLAASENRVVAFSPQMTVDQEAVDAWLGAIGRGLTDLSAEQAIDVPATVYKTAIGADIKGVPLAVQVAMEQHAGAILVTGIGAGQMPVSREKAGRLLNFSILNALGSGDLLSDSSGGTEVDDLSEGNVSGMLAPLEDDQQQWRQVMKQAFDRMDAENELREDAGLSLGFIRDVFDYVRYTPDHILDHLLTVGRAVYPIENKKVQLPVIEFAQLTAGGKELKREQLLDFRGFEKQFKSKVAVIQLDGLSARDKSKRSMASLRSARPAKRNSAPGIPTVKFLGIRDKGERFIFILDVSGPMLAESSGGEVACTYIKQAIIQELSDLPSRVLFNVILHDGATVAAYRPEMIPVSREAISGLEEWLAPILTEQSPAGLSPDQNTYFPQKVYKTAVGGEAKCWVRAMQDALEQQPDTVFVVGRDWGLHAISQEKGQRMIDFSLWQVLGGDGQDSFAGSSSLDEDRQMRDDLVVDAVDAIAEEESLRKEEKDPVPFLHDFFSYMQYTENQIMEHVDRVCSTSYELKAPPHIHFLRLVSEENDGVSDASTKKIRDLVRAYDGEFEFLNGTGIRDKILDKNDDEEDDEDDLLAEGDEEPESAFKFFGTDVRSSSVAFLLDVTDKMFAEETGGFTSFEFIKGQIARMVHTLDPETPFNIIAYGDQRVVAFTSKMKCGCDPEELDEWLAAVDQGLEDFPDDESVDVTLYPTAIGEDIKGFPLAVQVAMEQHARTILVAGSGIGLLPMDRAKARRLSNFSILNSLGSRGSEASTSSTREDDLSEGANSGMLAPLSGDQRQWKQMMQQALAQMDLENVAREEEDLPLGFVRDLYAYIQYTPGHILDHLKAVARAACPVEIDKVELPQMHFAQLIGPEQKVTRELVKEFRGFTKPYHGEVQFLRGADSEDEIRKLNRIMGLYK